MSVPSDTIIPLLVYHRIPIRDKANNVVVFQAVISGIARFADGGTHRGWRRGEMYCAGPVMLVALGHIAL